MTIPKYIVFRVDVMRNGTSMELTNITDEVEDVIFKADCRDEPNLSEKPNSSDEPQTNLALPSDSEAHKYNTRMAVEEEWLKSSTERSE